jgi:hypothetical protein
VKVQGSLKSAFISCEISAREQIVATARRRRDEQRANAPVELTQLGPARM